MKELKLVITHYKILDTIAYLNEHRLYPLSDGVYKIVAGIIDEETVQYRDVPTFSTLISFGSKKICRYLLALQRHGYIRKRFNRETNNLYYEVTNLGTSALLKYHKKHKKPYVQKARTYKPTIVKM